MLLLVVVVDVLSGRSLDPRGRILILSIVLYLSITFVYLIALRTGRAGGVAPVYAFLVLDPILLTLALHLQPEKFAFLNPFLFVVIVGTGLRYGIRALYLSWLATLLSSLALLTEKFWREEIELTLSYFSLLILVPILFSSLIRRVHGARALEEERARLLAKDESVVARSAFLAKVSHELRSPLQGIVSALDVLAMRRGPGADPDDELIGRIRRSSLLLNTHLRDMLTLAKGEAGRLEMRPEPFDACALVDNVAVSAADLAADKRLELIVDVPASATFVVADGARIDQILTNLVINSIRYTGRGQVRLALAPYDKTARLLRFTVADTGPGIPAAMLPTLLTPDRAITGSERRGEGSGIGLAIVRTLVDHLDGRIEVQSQLGKGTTFTVAIPAEPVESDEDDAARDAPTGRILIVDDRDDVLDALASVLDELGFECDRATSAAVAANLLASRPYDAALLDIEMPVMGGAELAAETRRSSGPNAGTRFIGMSAAEVGDDVKRGFDACLVKPIDHGALRHAVLGMGQGARPSQPGLWSDAG
ncbi:MAG TPA: hybrid sensor histidine kinase/response regulator [Caldimonas sp.]|nr:hybrid sensor histidine kinase/response regulator [Caldimonas sp.]